MQIAVVWYVTVIAVSNLTLKTNAIFIDQDSISANFQAKTPTGKNPDLDRGSHEFTNNDEANTQDEEKDGKENEATKSDDQQKDEQRSTEQPLDEKEEQTQQNEVLTSQEDSSESEIQPNDNNHPK
jgi:hypothetical protein